MEKFKHSIVTTVVKFDKLNAFLDEVKWPKKEVKYSYFAFLILIVFAITYRLCFNTSTYFESMLHLSVGFLISIVIIPFHECIHFIAFKFVGAKNISLVSFLRKGYVLIVADQFKMTKEEAFWVLLSPFIVLSTLSALLIFVVKLKYVLIIFGFLLFHTSICSTDFQLWSIFKSDQDTLMTADTKNGHFEFSKRTSKG